MDAMEIVRRDPGAYLGLSPHYQNHVHVALVAVAGDGRLLEHLPRGLKERENVARTAISQSPLAVQYASAKLRNDRNIGLSVVIRDPQALMFLSSELQAADSLTESTPRPLFVAHRDVIMGRTALLRHRQHGRC